ncbi:MAG: pentapeptide repeat-containing protein [Candidatus Binataceae bacterium]
MDQINQLKPDSVIHAIITVTVPAEQIDRIVSAGDGNLLSLAKAAELDPKTDFAGADLKNLDLDNEVLDEFNFSHADLSNVSLKNASLRSVNFSAANLTGANLTGANLTGATVSSANLSLANLDDIKGIETIEGLNAVIGRSIIILAEAAIVMGETVFSSSRKSTGSSKISIKIRPLGERVLVRRIEEGKLQRSIATIVADSRFTSSWINKVPQNEIAAGVVLDVGAGRVDRDKLRLPFVKGQRILFGKYAGSEVNVQGEEHLILTKDDILQVLDKP